MEHRQDALAKFTGSQVHWVVCPQCGAQWDQPENGRAGRCAGCGSAFDLSGNTLTWQPLPATPIGKRTWGQRLKGLFNPLSSPILPFRYWNAIRIERYYRRALGDLQLAQAWRDHYLRDLSLPSRPTVLDFGCGRGRSAAMMRQLGFCVAAQDIATNTWWRRLPDVFFQSAHGYTRLPWRDQCFDLVTEFMVINYLSPEQLHVHISEIHRVLKPGGYWVLLEPNDGSLGKDCFLSHYGRLHSLAKVRAAGQSIGFGDVDVSYEAYYAAHFPLAVNFLRKALWPAPYDISDFDSMLAARLPPEQRGMWLLRMRRGGN